MTNRTARTPRPERPTVTEQTPPEVIRLCPEGIPDELKARKQWVCWRLEFRDGSNGRPGKWTKPPINARQTDEHASSTAAGTWSPYERALSAYRAGNGRLKGIGYVFAEDDPFTGIDLDHCRNPDTGQVEPLARDTVERMKSYAEVSPSGTGVKIFVRAKLPPGAKHRKKIGTGEIELYDSGRYFTVTGMQVEGTPTTIEDRQAELSELYQTLFPAPRAGKALATSAHEAGGLGYDGNDDELLEKARRAANGPKFSALFDRGDASGHGDDDSAADLALCSMLAFWCGPDPDRIDRLFRRSKLYRTKWDERHRGDGATYGQMTVERALSGALEFHDAASVCLQPGSLAPGSGKLILSPRDPLPSARAFLEERYSWQGVRTLRHYAGLFHHWRDNSYLQAEEAGLRADVYRFLEVATRLRRCSKGTTIRLVPFQPNKAKVDTVIDALKAEAHLPATIAPPAWLIDRPNLPPAAELLPCRSTLLHLPTMQTLQATPEFFTTSTLAIDYDENAPVPKRWLRFLDQLWRGDPESIATLQMWFGHLLIADTRQQKILMLVGPKRSGKGTIGRVLTALLGERNVAGPTTSGLARPFGLQSLIGKSLAIVSDARFAGQPDSAVVIERLLSISGEDSLTIPRKYLPDVTLKLPTRFLFLTNELPRLRDTSGALASRFVVLQLTQTFLGREDTRLTEKLIAELPAILKWSVEGWRILQRRGRFNQPQSAADAMQQLEDLGSPIGAFIRECCVAGPEHEVGMKELFAAWKTWCREHGIKRAGNEQTFGRDLRAARPRVQSCRPRERDGSRPRKYVGIGLSHRQ